MTATERLRELLDERGVKWEDYSDEKRKHTDWNNWSCWFIEYPDGWTSWGMTKRGTPEQAIAATLGNDGAERSNDGVGRSNDGVAERGTRYERLFGTPERAAQTLRKFCADCFCGDCATCGVPDWANYTRDYDALLEWLRGDAE